MALDCTVSDISDEVPYQRCQSQGRGLHEYEINAEGACAASFNEKQAQELGISTHPVSQANRDTGNFFTTHQISTKALNKLDVIPVRAVPSRRSPHLWSENEMPCSVTLMTKTKTRFSLHCTQHMCFGCVDCSVNQCLYCNQWGTDSKTCTGHAKGVQVAYDCTIKKWSRVWATSMAWQETHPPDENGNAKYNARAVSMGGMVYKNVTCEPLKKHTQPNGRGVPTILPTSANVCSSALQLFVTRA